MVRKTVKRVVALLLVTMIIMSFTACKSKSDDADSTEDTTGTETLAEGETYNEIDIPQDMMGLSKALKEADSKIESAVDNSEFIQKYYDKNTISSSYNYSNNVDASNGERYEVTLVTKSYDYILKEEYAERAYENKVKALEETTEASVEASESTDNGKDQEEVTSGTPDETVETTVDQPLFDELSESSQLAVLGDVRANVYVYMNSAGDIDRVDIVYNYLDTVEGMQDEAKKFLGDMVTNLFNADVSKVVDTMWDSQNVTIPSDDGDIAVVKTVSKYDGINVVSVAFNRIENNSDSKSVDIMDREIATGYNLTELTTIKDFMDKIGTNIGTGESYISSMYESNNRWYKGGESEDFSTNIYAVAPKTDMISENDISFAELTIQKIIGTQESHMATFEVSDGNFKTYNEAVESSKTILKDVFGYDVSEEYDDYNGYSFSDENATINCYIQEFNSSDNIEVDSQSNEVENDTEFIDGESETVESTSSNGDSKSYYIYDLQVNVRAN